MINQIKFGQQMAVRRSCAVLGFRRQTYYHRKQGHRPEELDGEIAELLHQVTKRFITWGFWIIFHFLRKEGHGWNHKRVYRIWKAESLHLRLPPRRAKIRREYLDLLTPGSINEGWAMDFVSDWVVGPGQEKVRIINIMGEYSRNLTSGELEQINHKLYFKPVAA